MFMLLESPPPQHTHTHTCARNINSILDILKICVLSLIVFCNISYLILYTNNSVEIKEKWT